MSLINIGIIVTVNRKGFTGRKRAIALRESAQKTTALVADDEGKITDVDLADVRVPIGSKERVKQAAAKAAAKAAAEAAAK
jgi:hypothetical protein